MASMVAGVIGLVALGGFLFVERTSSHPMLPLRIFRSRQFSGTNLTTLAVYAGLGGAFFLVVLRLQISLGYSALEAGAALVPFTVLMLLLSPSAGQLGQKVGARLPMTVGPIVAAAGILLLSRIAPGDTYVSGVLPGNRLRCGNGTDRRAPHRCRAGKRGDEMTGVASGVNNAVARSPDFSLSPRCPRSPASRPGNDGERIERGIRTALRISAAVTAAGGVIAALVVRGPRRYPRTPTISSSHASTPPCRA